MSRINSSIVAAASFVFFAGCALKDVERPEIAKAQIAQDSNVSALKTLDNKTDMTMPNEAAMFMSAVDAIDERDYERASYYLSILYQKTKKKQYLPELIKIYSALGQYDKAKSVLLSAIAENPDDMDAKKMLAANYIQQKEYKSAFEIAEAIAQKTKQKEDYDTAGSIAYVLGDYKSAQKYFKSSYALKADDISADRIATILFMENKPGEATRFLETHIRMFNCSKYLCERLANAYIEQNDQRGALEMYKKLYFKTKDERYIKKIIELSVAGSDVDGLIAFLKKSKKDEALLFEAYKYKKDNKNAAVTALKLYKKTKDVNYLAQATIYKFESYPEKKPLWLIKESVKNLTIVTGRLQNDVYDNYLGYLLIDYDLDVNKGVELVKRALAKDPTSVFYLDSLAWGYYKQKKCVEANEIIKKILPELKDDKTVAAHAQAIKKCLQGQK